MKTLTNIEEAIALIENLRNTPYAMCFSKSRDELREKLNKHRMDKDSILLEYREEGILEGVFDIFIIEDEAYLELGTFASQNKNAYIVLLDYLEHNYKGFEIYFISRPGNDCLLPLLKEKNAKFYTRQNFMELKSFTPYESTYKIIPYEEQYREEYISIHNKDLYWTGDKVIEALDEFSIVLAIDGAHVVGYCDITHNRDINTVFHIQVLEEYRGKGIAKALLTKAILGNPNQNVVLEVDIDNPSAIRVYETLGFVENPKESSQTIHLYL